MEISKRELEEGEKLALVVDIECSGYDLNIQPVLAIGWIVGNLEREEIFDKGRVSFLSDAYSFRQENVKRYEDMKQAKLLKKSSFPPLDPNKYVNSGIEYVIRGDWWAEKGWIFDKRCYDSFWMNHLPVLDTLFRDSVPPETAISDFLNLENKYPISTIISDNPSYDISRIDFAIERYSNREYGMHYYPTGEYRSVIDVSSACEYLPANLGKKIFWGMNSHFPDDDAYNIYQAHLSLQKLMEKININ